MSTARLSLTLLLGFAWPIAAQSLNFNEPVQIYNKGVVNTASVMAPDLPGGAIAQGSVFSIYGSNLGPTNGVQVNAFPLQTTFQNVSIKVFRGTTSVDALPIYVSATQINALMPSNAPLGRVSVQVTYNAPSLPCFGPGSAPCYGPTSNPVPVTVIPSSFGIFALNGGGFGPGILQNFISQASQPINSAKQTARPGQVITMWGTGLGPLAVPDNVAPPAASLPVQVEVFVGGKSANVAYSGRTPCCSGVDQIVFTVPQDAPQGCFVPVQVRVAGQVVSNAVTMAISLDGSTCSDPANPLEQNLLSGGNYGAVLAHRIVGTLNQFSGTPPNFVFDVVGAALWNESGAPGAYNPYYSLPPRGSCTIFTAAGDLLGDTPLSGLQPTGHALDGGSPLILSGAGAPPPLPLLAGAFFGLVGSNVPALAVPSTVFDQGTRLTVSIPGGVDVGPLQANFLTTAPVSWTNGTQLAQVDRGHDLTFAWSGGDDQHESVLLGGISSDTPTHSSAAFLCLASPANGSFTIPSYVLANLPATRATETLPKSWLFLGSIPLNGATPFSVHGVDAGFAIFSPWNVRAVVYR